MKKRRNYTIIVLVFLALILLVIISTNIFSSFKRMTGFAATTQTFTMNISISGNNAPVITVYNNSMTSVASGLNEGPTTTPININFTVYDADGNGNINDSTAQIKFTKTGEETRSNTSCYNLVDYGTYYANYTCNLTMYWWDGSGTWSITANITDNDNKNASNTTTNFQVGATDGFVAAPTSLTWNPLAAGATNSQPTNDPILMNNTGNVNKFINVNSTNLRGESTPNLAIWGANFTVNASDSCLGTAMVYKTYTNITSATLPKGNFTISNGTAGQEQIYFCITQVGAELTAQAYSTANTSEGAWTVQIVTNT